MPARRALSPQEEELVWQLWARRVPQTGIARQFNVSRKVVSSAVGRVQRELAEGRHADLEAARDEALGVYDLVQQAGWARMAKCAPNSTASVGYLSAIIEARRQQDRLLGLEKITVDHRAQALAKVEHLLDTAVPIALPGAESGD
jgi:hypothetical protein